MKKMSVRKLIILTSVLFVINLAALAYMYLPARFSVQHDTGSPSEPPAQAEVSDTDVSSGSDLPVVSIAEVPEKPEIVLTSLAGTNTSACIDDIASNYHCTGLTVAVIKDGEVAYHYETGFADKKKKRELNRDTKFRIASLSKVYTSTLGMKLVEDGKLELDGDIGDVFGYRVRNPYHKDTPITPRMLFTHTSSIRDRTKYTFSGDIRYDIQDRDSYSYLAPGTGFLYSNLAMGIAGALIEAASGLQLTEYSNQAFFNGMEIDAAYNGAMLKDKDNIADCIYGTEVERSAERLAQPHADKEPGKNHTVAAGGLIISAVDYAKVITLFTNDGTYKGVSYLSPETIAAMHEPQFECEDFLQCIGIRKSDKVLSDRTVYYHTGAAYGIFSLAIYDVTDKSGVVVFTTGSYAKSNSMGIRNSCLETAEVVYSNVIEGGDQMIPEPYAN